MGKQEVTYQETDETPLDPSEMDLDDSSVDGIAQSDADVEAITAALGGGEDG